MASPEIGICHKLGEVKFEPITKYGISRFCRRVPKFPVVITTRKSGPDKGRMSKIVESRDRDGARNGPIIGTAQCSQNGGTSGTVISQTTPNVKNQGFVERKELRGPYPSGPREPKRIEMVAGPSEQLEWQNIPVTQSRPSHLLGCVDARLGVRVRRPEDSGCVEQRRIFLAHKRTRAAGSELCDEGFYDKQKQSACIDENRQYDNSGVSQQDGRYTFR